ncbi:MAG: DUF1016 domain-containing protein [Deltaproteobacteria bacterium]|nr:DUF1016 family protein [bacterium]MCB9476856.1 DUF1016 domain-containing protein [Deltaproteobacteria bacterium]MCB9489535.1 DUF1016 domain-containing protein [Deltaproteobacteria bacterium]
MTKKTIKESDAKSPTRPRGSDGYDRLFGALVQVIETGRHAAASSVNSIMTATYWEIGRRIVEKEQGGKSRAEYGEELIDRLSRDMTILFGRGFSKRNLANMRLLYLTWPILQALPAKSSSLLPLAEIADHFRLTWTHYVSLMQVENELAREFYEKEALRGGWTTRQLERQIGTQFYERTALSKNKAAMLTKGAKAKPDDLMTPEEEIKDPYVLEFLNLKDEYSESELEEALIQHLEAFLLELGGDFTFVGRQRRLRVGDSWFRIDLLFYHRRLRCLILIDLKLGKFTPADAGQMHLYLNYARTHWTHDDENPPVGLILCAEKNAAVAHYSLEGLPNKTVVTQYRTALPNENALADEIEKTRKLLEARAR